MKVTVYAKPKAKQAKIETAGSGELRVWVREAPQDGKANDAIEAAVARHFDVPKSCVRIKKGHTAKKKIVEISM
ncbi:DUF167 domain-containing protein [Candidatus Peregrinibacteria bacterium]|nr:DUF167 domain-containing protein [Candidatus Peregrinibacteria bacterium]